MKINRPPPTPGTDAARNATTQGQGKTAGAGSARGAPAAAAAGQGVRGAGAQMPGLDDVDSNDPDVVNGTARDFKAKDAAAGKPVQRRSRQRPHSDQEGPALGTLMPEARELMEDLQRQADALPGAEHLFASGKSLKPGQRDESLVDYLLSAARQARSIKASGNSPVMVQMQGVRAYMNATDSLPDTPPTLASVKSLLVSRQEVKPKVKAKVVDPADKGTLAARPGPGARLGAAESQRDMFALLPLMALNAMQVKPQRLAAVRAARIDLVMALGRRVKLAAGE